MPRDITRLTTLADLLAEIEGDPDLSSRQSQDWRSAINSFGKHTGKGIGLVANPLHLRPALMHWKPQSCSTKTWANIRSNVTAILKHYRCLDHSAAKSPTGQLWAPLRARLTSPRFERGLSRVVNWLTNCGIRPEDVSADTFDRYLEFLEIQTLLKRPDKVYRDTCQLWNRAVESVNGWPQLVVPVPQYRDVITLGEAAFPDSFRADLDAWERRVSGKDRLNRDSTLQRPLRPATYKGERATFIRCASILVRENILRREGVMDLSVLTKPEHVRAILQFHLDRHNNEVTRGTEKIANSLRALARHWVKAEDDDLEELKELANRVHIKNRGMTPKAKERLSQFDDEATLAAFIDLPWDLQKEAAQIHQPKKAARAMRLAVTIAIGLSAPVRRRNIVELHLDRHISIRRKGRRTECQIHYNRNETKTNQDLDYGLNPEVTALLLNYRDNYRQALVVEEDGNWLFPGDKSGRHLTPEQFGGYLSTHIKKRLGIKFNMHLFRHLAAKIYLDKYPEDVATVQQLLGHRQTQTTIDFYCDLDRVRALSRYDEALFDKRKKT